VLTGDLARLEALALAGGLDALALALADTEPQLYVGLDGLDPAFDEWLGRQRRMQQDRII
jgi:hypothetical protein